jgi:poly(hydroxyalkanoate) granule-associated protein
MTDKDVNDQEESSTGADISNQLENVFLAGLGALSTVTEVGAKTFDSLVDQGEDYRAKASKKTDELIGDVQDAVRGATEGAQSKASGLFDQVRETSKVDRLQEVFDRRVDSALKRLRVPSQSDMDVLNAKLDKILKIIDAKPAKRAKAAKATKASKPAAKKAAD